MEIARFLLDHGAFVNVQEARWGRTELHAAAGRGFRDLADMLIEAGARTDIRDNKGKTAADLAFERGFSQIGYALLAAGAPDSNLVAQLTQPSPLEQEVAPGEAFVWHLGHSGWAVKTQNNFLVFDYFSFPEQAAPDQPSLACGRICPTQLQGQNVTCFVSHHHGDHLDSCIYGWRDSLQNIAYVSGCPLPGLTQGEYTFMQPRQDTTVNDIRVTTIYSTDAGVGFLVEVDGLTLLHAGDHANGGPGLMQAYTDEIDFAGERAPNIDFSFFGIRGCSLGDPESVRDGVYYSLEHLNMGVTFLQHAAAATWAYQDWADSAAVRFPDAVFGCPTDFGEVFHVKDGKLVQNDGTLAGIEATR
ncbi:MAG: MBL fold metallo-hydrolase, partial [candidate division Zixibacteria bacterium]|nr:MBL fold metallo-hydrolase [candidate division Zixibacteria bacterium]